MTTINKSFNDSKITNYHTTFLSKPLDKINIPEITNFTAEFQYNFFKKNERTEETDTNLIAVSLGTVDDVLFETNIAQKPRFAKLTWGKPKINNTSNTNLSEVALDEQQLKTAIIPDGINLNDILNDVLIEGAISNKAYTGFELIDTGKEQKIYSMLRTSELVMDVSTVRDSRKTAAQKLHDKISQNGSLTGEDKKLVVEALANIKNQNMQFVEKELFDNGDNTALPEDDPASRQTFSIQLNSLFMHDIIKQASVYCDNVYQDELRGLLDISKEIQVDLLNSSDLNVSAFNELDYELQVNAINVEPIPLGAGADVLDEYPEVLFAGYLVEKYRENDDQTMTYLGRKTIQNIDINIMTDHNVAYGKKYFYKIRTICQVKTIVSAINVADPSTNQNLIATIYVASEGITRKILCAENIPPSPPTSMRITFDFKTLKPRISWQFPLNKQRDIKRFQIFKRLTIDKPFTLIGEYDFDNSEIRTPLKEVASPESVYYMTDARTSFIDHSHREGEKPIYTVSCVDAHGLSSNYGPQLQVERDKYTNKVKRTVISAPDAPKPYPNLLINKDAFLDSIKVSRYKKIKLFFDPEYYKVLKDSVTEEGEISENDLNFLMVDPGKFTYKMQLINLDNQKDQIVKIKLTDNTSQPLVDGVETLKPAETVNRNNLSFQYGIN